MSEQEFAKRIQELDDQSGSLNNYAQSSKNESTRPERGSARLGIALVALVASGILGYKGAEIYRENPDKLSNIAIFADQEKPVSKDTASNEVAQGTDQPETDVEIEVATDEVPQKTISGEFAKQLFAVKRHLRASTYLPEEGEGWTRLTTNDVRDWDAMEEIRMNWSEQASAVHWTDLTGLNDFIEAEKDGFMNGHESAAIYFKPNGHIIELRISFLSKSQPGFGNEYENHKVVLQKMAANEEIEAIKIAGLEFAHTAINNQMNREFSVNTLRRQTFDFHTYLTPSVKISLTGHATVEEIEGLLGGLDYDRLNTLEVN